MGDVSKGVANTLIHKVLTYVQSCVWRFPKYWPPTPLSTQRVCPPYTIHFYLTITAKDSEKDFLPFSTCISTCQLGPRGRWWWCKQNNLFCFLGQYFGRRQTLDWPRTVFYLCALIPPCYVDPEKQNLHITPWWLVSYTDTAERRKNTPRFLWS
jgi:hypothetical protein